MPYTANDLRLAVRALVRVRQSALPDADLDPILLLGKRKVDDVRPASIGADVAGSGSKSYQLTGVVSGWENDFSRIIHVYNPAPDWSSDDEVNEVPSDELRVRRDPSGNDWLRMSTPAQTGNNFQVMFTGRWAIQDLAGDPGPTTLPDRYKNALEFICASYACDALASEYASTSPRQFQGAEFLDVTNMQRRFREQAEAFLAKFENEVGLIPGVIPAAIGRDAYATDQQVIPYLTHRVNRKY